MFIMVYLITFNHLFKKLNQSTTYPPFKHVALLLEILICKNTRYKLINRRQ